MSIGYGQAPLGDIFPCAKGWLLGVPYTSAHEVNLPKEGEIVC